LISAQGPGILRSSDFMAGTFPSLKGQLLLDSGQLRGSFFHRSVVLVCHHDADGAFGLTLTQPTPQKLGDVLVADLAEPIKEQPLFIGGPVQANALTFLHSDPFLPEANVLPNLSMSHSLDDLQELGESFAPERKIRCFAGYAGWSGGQLEGEMKRKAWLVHPAGLDEVFAQEPARLWRKILAAKGWQHRLLASGPEDFSWN